MYSFIKHFRSPYFLLYFILGSAFITRIINLNYNVAFNDEAIYIVIGRLGIFEWDWTTYNPSSWMGGIPYVYPSLSAISYIVGGLVGSRFLNVVFGVLTIEIIFLIAYQITDLPQKFKLVAGLVAASLMATDPVSHYVSRLATYDMPCFYFLFLSLALLLFGLKNKHHAPQLYFAAAIALIISFSIKIISGIYFPLYTLFFWISSQKASGTNHLQFRKYFLLPMSIFLTLFLVMQIDGLIPYFTNQTEREKATFAEIIKAFMDNSRFIWPFWVLSTIGVVWKRKIKIFLMLHLAAFAMLSFHLLTSRIPTLDKHIFVSIGFLVIAIGIGISYLLASLPNRRFLSSFLIGAMIGLSLVTLVFTYPYVANYNNLWRNSTTVHEYLRSEVKPDDHILTELGAATMLYTYDQLHPTHVITFDWFEYSKKSGEAAYKQAVFDGYFDYILLESENSPKSNTNAQINSIVRSEMETLYYLAYQEDDFEVYKRNYE